MEQDRATARTLSARVSRPGRPGPLNPRATPSGAAHGKGPASAPTACDDCDCVLSPARSATLPQICAGCDCGLKANENTSKENGARNAAGPANAGAAIAADPIVAPLRDLLLAADEDAPLEDVGASSTLVPVRRRSSSASASSPRSHSPIPARTLPPDLVNCPNFVTSDVGDTSSARHPSCDACDFCDDVCAFATCGECNLKRDRVKSRKCQTRVFTMCEVRRGSTVDYALLTANKQVYDITGYIRSERHPGGQRALLRKLGTDVAHDFAMHNKGGKRMWKSFVVGKLAPCPKEQCSKRTPWKLTSW